MSATTPAETAPPLPIRILLALGAAALAALYVRYGASVRPDVQSDFDQIWYGARALRMGQDPYAVIGPGREWGVWPWPLFYPLPALLPAIPLSYLDVVTAREVFSGISAGCFTLLVSRRGYAHLASLLSASMLSAIAFVQFAPLIACAVLSPVFGWVLCCKPNMGLAALTTSRSNRWFISAVAGSIVLLAISLVLQPSWPLSWLSAVREGEHFTPYALRPGRGTSPPCPPALETP